MTDRDVPQNMTDMRIHLQSMASYHGKFARHLERRSGFFIGFSAFFLLGSVEAAFQGDLARAGFLAGYLALQVLFVWIDQRGANRHRASSVRHVEAERVLDNENFDQRLAHVQARLESDLRPERTAFEAAKAMAFDDVRVRHGKAPIFDVPRLHRWCSHWFPFSSASYAAVRSN